MFSQFGYRIPPAAGGVPIALTSLGGGSKTGAVAGAFYENTVVTVGTMDKWILCSTTTISVSNSTIARISSFDYISSATTHNMALLNEVQLVSPSQGNAACLQHWGVRVNDGINFGTFRRYVDAGGADAQHHYYNRMRIEGSALNLVAFDEGRNSVDTGTSIGSDAFDSNGSTEQVLYNQYRSSAIGAVTLFGQDAQHYNTTLGAVSYITEARVDTAQTAHVVGGTWSTARPAIGLTTRIKSI